MSLIKTSSYLSLPTPPPSPRTDVLFFTLDPDSGNVINPSIIVRRIDQNYPILDNALSDCKVERIRVRVQLVWTGNLSIDLSYTWSK